jgi:hypothetical protein
VVKLLYRPLGMAFSVAGGLAASALLEQIWKRISGEEEAPSATQADSSWKQVLPGAALQGAVFATVKAAADRGGLKAFEKTTGVWAGD